MNLEQYDAFEKELTENHPTMFAEPYGGICVGEGWWPIIKSLCAGIQSHMDWVNRNELAVAPVVVQQIKEKFGGLRFYYQGGDDYIRGMVHMAESWASHACEECGAPATHQTKGWIKTVCKTHFEESEKRKQERVS